MVQITFIGNKFVELYWNRVLFSLGQFWLGKVRKSGNAGKTVRLEFGVLKAQAVFTKSRLYDRKSRQVILPREMV